jgi:hypothetical protein
VARRLGPLRIGDRPWFARLVVVEVADLAAIAGDDEVPLTGDVAFTSR